MRSDPLESGDRRRASAATASAGRWVRAGGEIILFGVPGHHVADVAESEMPLPVETYETKPTKSSVVHPHIDVCAQRSLQVMSGDRAQRTAAAGLLKGVRSGALAGIYGNDLRAVATLAARHRKTRFSLLPPGLVAGLVLDPLAPHTASPTVVFRKEERREAGRLQVECPDLRSLAAALHRVYAAFVAWKTGAFLCPAGKPSSRPAGEFEVSFEIPRLLCAPPPAVVVLPPSPAAAQPVRDRSVDAFFEDEWGPKHPNDDVHFNKFTTGTLLVRTPLSAAKSLKNPLDKTITPSLRQPELIPSPYRGEGAEYNVFVPQKLIDAHRGSLTSKDKPKPLAKISVLFCVGQEITRHGLRSFFQSSSDRVLITVPGREAAWIPERTAWGIGINEDQIKDLLAAAGVAGIKFEVRVLAAYSTGYRGLNGVINNSLLPIDKVEVLIFYDALYRGDEPPPLPGQAKNTARALAALKKATADAAKVVTYEVSSGGTPRDASDNFRVKVPLGGVVNLKKHRSALTALIFARVLGNGVKDKYFPIGEVPAPIARLIAGLPSRGTMRSSAVAPQKAGATLLADWAKTNSADVAGAVKAAGKARSLIRKYQLMGWAPPDGEEIHDGFLQEFGWEFLAGL